MISYGFGNDDYSAEKVVWDQYRVWKRYMPGLYSHATVHPFEWPVLSLDWLPEDDCRDEHGYSINYLLMGTHAHSKIDTVAANSGWDEVKPTSGARPAQLNNFIYNLTCTLPSVSERFFGERTIDRLQIGRVGVKQKMAHNGEVNCIKHMPQNPHVIASRGPVKGNTNSSSAPVYVYYLDNARDLTAPQDAPATSSLGGNGQIDDALYLNLIGHKDEGVALSWNKKRDGLLASGADDGQVLIWDIEDRVRPSELTKFEGGSGSPAKGIPPLCILSGHEAEVQGVDFHPSHQHLLYTVSDDRSMRIWDTRLADKGSMTNVRNAHSSTINCVQAHPFAEHVVATAGKDVVKIWDIRFEGRSEPPMTLRGHAGEITCLEWAPHSETVLATGSTDRTVVIWDIERHSYQERYDNGRIECCPWLTTAWSGPPADDVPPDDLAVPKEVMFVHLGHTAPVTCLSWNPNEDWFIATASQDNMLHIWQVSQKVRDEDVCSTSSDENEEMREMPGQYGANQSPNELDFSTANIEQQVENDEEAPPAPQAEPRLSSVPLAPFSQRVPVNPVAELTSGNANSENVGNGAEAPLNNGAVAHDEV
eukprot:TRINITY_DN27097_c0_g1_i1.p1 TRINITY_DN27097_c0_g1~~TRINITY_DN27097_c0_g1_i1.p1  ORF type:complete len:605 (+),score=109.05 TRINITY_DN27097_c0_g1_i1:45-1817(+)